MSYTGRLWRSIRDIAFVAAMLVVQFRTASAQAVQTLDEAQSRLQGQDVYVGDGAGREVRGTVADISRSSVRLLVDGDSRNFDAANIQFIDRHVGDSRLNGALWGLAIGAGAGFVGMLLSRGMALEDLGRALALATIVAPAAGTAAGVAIDASTTARERVYARTPTSSRGGASLGLSGHGVGLAVQVRF